MDDFWSWWTQEGASTAARAISNGTAERLVPLIAPRVRALHPDLAWELAPGPDGSEHVLVVTAEGDPKLRAHARRWLLGAPPPDRTWAYSDSRLPGDDEPLQLSVGDHEITSDDVVVAWSLDDRHDCLDVTVHHPAMAQMPEQVRQQLTLVLLDHTLGETTVETWIGGIESAVGPLPTPVADQDKNDDDDGDGVGGLPQLRAAVSALADSRVDDDGTPIWKLAESTADDGSVTLALFRVPLRSASAPHLEQHVELTLPFRHVTEAGLPDAPSLQALRAFTDEAEAALSPHAMLVAHESSAGRRVLHFYVDPLSDAGERLRQRSAAWSEGPSEFRSTPDPAWEQVAHLR
ncbi:DUF695 domain-containing protein [Quadrisphaera granulorum]|uniref:DUF695 domain-containing protein n=1 Tax=Quadrisphaera granulorum TaxID=317664 RepID=UPI0014746C56|nr:DUF695 domain-containing protein [Quadrisphaera granulorum]